ncbi:MAG: methyltransferase domain-containing protein [Acidobacteriota bacterium]
MESRRFMMPLRKAALVVGRRLVEFGEVSERPRLLQVSDFMEPVAYARRVRQEIDCYKAVEKVHELPEIFHFWSNRYVRPKLEEVLGVSGFPDLCIRYISRCARQAPRSIVEICSLGSGNGEIEVPIARALVESGVDNFRFVCLDLNQSMLNRALERAEAQGLGRHFVFEVVDLAQWRSRRPVALVMAHHSLHHVVELEQVFQRVLEAIGDEGYFLVSDMVGRNGHMRWPEALEIVRDIWKTMPDRYKYNHQLRRFEAEFDNWDASKEGFEGIRAQDILPLLLETFHFESFVAYGNLPDVFVDRSFGHNFDAECSADREFIDRLGAMNDQLVDQGILKPTQMIAVMRTPQGSSPPPVCCYRHWTPAFCVRYPFLERRSSLGLGHPGSHSGGQESFHC